jgi:hypothetical protein
MPKLFWLFPPPASMPFAFMLAFPNAEVPAALFPSFPFGPFPVKPNSTGTGLSQFFKGDSRRFLFCSIFWLFVGLKWSLKLSM